MTTIVLWPTKSNALKLVEQNLQTHVYINICRLECYKDNSQKLYRCWCTKFHPDELGNRYTYNQYTKIIATLFYNTIHFPAWLSHQNPSEYFFLIFELQIFFLCSSDFPSQIMSLMSNGECTTCWPTLLVKVVVAECILNRILPASFRAKQAIKSTPDLFFCYSIPF